MAKAGDTVEQALEKALTEDGTPTVDTEDAKTQQGAEASEDGSKSKKGTDTVPYDRFKEVNDARKDALEKITSLEGKLDSFAEREKQLEELRTQLSESESLISRIKALAQDEKYRDHVVAIDKALQGIEDEVEEGTKSEDDAAVDVQKLVNKHKADLETAFAQQRADVLWTQANSLAEKYLEALPEDYTEQDRALISELWTSRVDWDSIEEDPSSMRDLLASSLKTTLDAYGEPRGAITAKAQQQQAETQKQAEPEPTAEEQLTDLRSKNFGELDKEGNPVVGDDDFTAELAKAMKLTRV